MTSRNNIDGIKCQLVTEIFEPNLPLCAKLLIRKYAFMVIYKNQNPINAQIVQFSSMKRKIN
jgi:ABC-type spermidine/putrescine transport system permease subunit I